MWRTVCIDSSNMLARWPWRLASLGMVLVLAGCDSIGGSGSTGANPRSVEAGGGLSGRTSSTGGAASNHATSTGKSQAKVVSQIEGDRLTVVAPVVLSKQTESSPFRFAEDRQGGGHRLRAFLGHDRGEALPHGQRLGRRGLRLRQRWTARHLFRDRHALPLGTAEKGPNRLYKNLGNGNVQGRDRRIRPGLSRLLPRNHRRRHRQRRRSGRIPLQSTAPTCSI